MAALFNLTNVRTSADAYRLKAGFSFAEYTMGLLASLALIGFFQIPPGSLLFMGGDNVQNFAFAKSYINGDGFRFNTALGFPGVQDTYYFPSFDLSYRLFLWLTSFFTDNPIVSYYALYLVGFSAMYVTSLLAFRWLGMRPWVATIGAALYIVTPYFGFRSLVHDFLALYFSVPLGAALALKIFTLSHHENFRTFLAKPLFWISVIVVATSGLYYAFFSAFFCVFLGVLGAVKQRRAVPLLLALAIVSIVFPLVLFSGYGIDLPAMLRGDIPQIPRDAMSQLSLGLSLAEGLHVLADVPFLSWMYDAYESTRPYLSNVTGLAEWPGVLLTAVVLTSPLLLSLTALSHPPAISRWNALLFACLSCIVIGIIYSINGGLAYYFNMLVSPAIRATARIMPFLTFFSLMFVLTISEICLSSKTYFARRVAPFLIFLALAASAAPAFGVLANKSRLALAQHGVQDNIESIYKMLSAKDRSHIQAVLQLPHVRWPESAPINGLTDPYSLEFPFVLDSPHSITRWSFGGYYTQESFLKINAIIGLRTGLPQAAIELGFDAIMIEKSAYSATELSTLVRDIITGSQRGCVVHEDDFRIMFGLTSRQCTPS
ncbi:hypothetical protein [Mesorhizobium sp. 1B3]|uniref:hypothetical protein n=1 Tax=Mesorhizobium sp. 1B3 TaxID=3243599 RepID=UPI003D972125